MKIVANTYEAPRPSIVTHGGLQYLTVVDELTWPIDKLYVFLQN